jgi:hypothetical protein
MRLEIGGCVDCSDGTFGELADVVIDPTTKRVMHLLVTARGEPWVERNLTGRGGGVFKSADGGRTWRRWRLKGDDIPALALPPGGRFLYAGDAEGSVFRIAG